ncbi:MAG: HU family DNA-binding protein [Candidatus Aminicenantia bacterium]
MNRTDLIIKICKNSGISRAQATKALDSFISGIEDALKKGKRVTLVGFGSFHVVRRKERKGRNPRTGKEIFIPSKRVVKFSPAKALKETIK